MLPVRRGEVEEGEQDISVLLQGRDGLRVLGPVLAGEPGDCLARLFTGLSVHHLVEGRFHARLEPPWELVEVGEKGEAGISPEAQKVGQTRP